MTTLTLWLLISVGSGNRPTTVVERFAEEAQCKQVAAAIRAETLLDPLNICVRAEVAR